MKVAAVASDLMIFSRIEAAASAAGAELVRVDHPRELPAYSELVLVDWSARDRAWGEALVSWRASAAEARIILYGRHTDLEGHAAARAIGLGPMWARSRLISSLRVLVGSAAGGS